MKNKRQMGLLFLAVFIDMVGFGMIVPVLPFIAENFGADGLMLGLLVASFSLMQFVFAPFWGMLSDKMGRRPVLLIGILGTSLSFLILGISQDLLLLFASRMLSGIFTAASLPTAQAYVADITEPKDRAKNYGLLGMAFGIGFAFGPALGGFLSQNSLLFPSLIAAGMSFLNFAGALVWLPETYKPTGETKKGKLLDFGKLKYAIRHPSVGPLIVTFAVVSFAFSGMEATYAFFGEQRAALTAQNVGLIFAMIGVIIIIAQGGLTGIFARKIGERNTLLFGLALAATGYLLISFASSFEMLMLFTGIMAFGFSLTFPTVNALLSMNVRPDEQGEIMGLNQGVSSLGRVVGPVFAGLVFVNVGIEWPFIINALIGFCAVAIAYRGVKKVPAKPAEPAENS